jgi:16S rRNA (guanine966-N2)-methyltransferase
VKESIFSSIAAEVPGAAVLDLYAGAGSFGIEAMSRGADSVVFVESGARALERSRRTWRRSASKPRSSRPPSRRYVKQATGRFDLVFCDPPWPMSVDEVGPRSSPISSRCSTTTPPS